MLCATWVWVFVLPTLINSYAQILIPPESDYEEVGTLGVLGLMNGMHAL